jgi:hypothetical protein
MHSMMYLLVWDKSTFAHVCGGNYDIFLTCAEAGGWSSEIFADFGMCFPHRRVLNRS